MLNFVYLPNYDFFPNNYEFKETNDDVEGGLDGYGGQGLDDEVDDEMSDDSDQDWESEYDDNNDDDDEDMQAMIGGEYDREIKTTNPFAPACPHHHYYHHHIHFPNLDLSHHSFHRQLHRPSPGRHSHPALLQHRHSSL